MVVSHRDVQLAVRAEVDGAAVVLSQRRQWIDVEQDGLGRRIGGVADDGEAADAVVSDGCRRGVVQIDEAIRRERRVERDTVEAPLAVAVDGQRDHRVRQQRAVLDLSELTALERDEDAIVGSNRHGCRSRERMRDHVGSDLLSERDDDHDIGGAGER